MFSKYVLKSSTSVVHSVRASVTVTEAPASAANTEATEDEETEDF
jgi:hypothetical protein